MNKSIRLPCVRTKGEIKWIYTRFMAKLQGEGKESR